MATAVPSSPVPAPRLQSALRRITEVLAAELANPTDRLPTWSELDWTLAKAVAAMHGVSPLLSHALRWRGPDHWHDFLDQQRLHTERRHVRILSLLDVLDEALRASNLPALALKGVALHALKFYRGGERPMADIDLLVRPEHARRTALILESLGFEATCVSWKETAFSPVGARTVAALGEHEHNPLKIELHDRICEQLPKRLTDLTAEIFPVDGRPGINAYPSTTSLLLHLMLHAAGAMTTRALRLVHLHDLALLSARMTRADWGTLGNLVIAQKFWWALPPLQLTSRYYRLPVPADVWTKLHRVCPRLLGRISRRRPLADVSFSHIWVDAFPGIAWAPSVPALAGYVASRLRPTAEHAALRQNTLSNQAWAAGGQWFTLSYTRRAVRWATSRPTRPVSMHAVYAALELAP